MFTVVGIAITCVQIIITTIITTIISIIIITIISITIIINLIIIMNLISHAWFFKCNYMGLILRNLDSPCS